MASEKYTQLVEFLTQHFEHLAHRGGSGSALDFPAFDLMPFDYLEFAEQELDRKSTASKINCVAHLKRAVECEMDTLLGVLGVTKNVRNFPKKLEFARDVGIVSSRSLAKLNQLRNRMEHEYATPDIEELEIYFDLASAFVHTVEGYIFMLYHAESMQWENEKNGHIKAKLDAKIVLSPPSIEFTLHAENNYKKINFESSSIEEYCEGLKAFFLLCRGSGILSRDYVISKLQDKPFQM